MAMEASFLRLQEKLKRKLSGTKAYFDEQDVRAYFEQIISPLVSAAGIQKLSVVLRSRTGQVVTAELQEGYLVEYEPYVQLAEAASKIGCSFFLLNTSNAMVAGYTENDWDWLVLKYEDKANSFLEPILIDFWAPFFDFV